MPDCAKLEKCPFFNDKMANAPATANLYKQRFCREDFTKCARFMVSSKLGPEKVPFDLFPNQAERAQEILNG